MNYVLIGKIHSAQGIKGEIFVSIFSEEAEWADRWETLYVSKDKEQQPSAEFAIASARTHKKLGRWGFAVRLDNVKDRNRAEELKGLKVYVPEDFLVSEEGEAIYLREVLGFRVIDQTRGDVGEVVGFAGNAMQDLLVIESEKGQFEVPFVEPLLVETDRDNKKLIMDIPQGLVAGEEL